VLLQQVYLSMTMRSYLLFVLAFAGACGRSESTRGQGQPATETVASSAATGAASPAAPTPAAKPVRVAIRLDGHDVKLTIPSSGPATFVQDDWAKALGMFATEQTEDEILLQVAFVPKAAGQQDSGSVDLDVFQQQAGFKQVVKRGEAVTLVPGNALPADGFGDSPPRELKVTWLR
jgi:hypothetical protein